MIYENLLFSIAIDMNERIGNCLRSDRILWDEVFICAATPGESTTSPCEPRPLLTRGLCHPLPVTVLSYRGLRAPAPPHRRANCLTFYRYICYRLSLLSTIWLCETGTVPYYQKRASIFNGIFISLSYTYNLSSLY